MNARRAAVILLSWWFLYVFSPDGRWTRDLGPFVERAVCERTAAEMSRHGIIARCLEVRF